MGNSIIAPSRQHALTAQRVVLYSHDTFGLGHLRRSRAIASALTQSGVAASAIILTGSPIAGRFTFPESVDHVRLPGVKKLADGSYASQTAGMDIDQTTALRSAIIRTAIDEYEPDLLIVDKEPTGFRGELLRQLCNVVRSHHGAALRRQRPKTILPESSLLRAHNVLR